MAGADEETTAASVALLLLSELGRKDVSYYTTIREIRTPTTQYILCLLSSKYTLGLSGKIYYILMAGSAYQECLYTTFIGHQTACVRSETEERREAWKEETLDGLP